MATHSSILAWKIPWTEWPGGQTRLSTQARTAAHQTRPPWSPRVCSNSCPSIHIHGDAIQISHPLSPHLLLPSIFPRIRVFSNESALCIRWLKCWSLSFCISPSDEYSGLISFRIDWFDLLAVQGTLKSLLQHLNPSHVNLTLPWQ